VEVLRVEVDFHAGERHLRRRREDHFFFCSLWGIFLRRRWREGGRR
jgi:hypothetical protein